MDAVSQFAPVVEKTRTSFYHQWGHQAWMDLALLRWLLRSTGDIVEKTWVPIIKLSAADKKQVDRDFAQIRNEHEKVSFVDSPREKWRKEYGAFIREIEWACAELYQYFPKEEYQDLITTTVGDRVAKWLENIFPKIDDMFGDPDGNGPKISKINIDEKRLEKIVKAVFRVTNFSSFMVDESYVESFNHKDRSMVIKIPDCGFHRAARMKDIPDQGCVFGCKGGCEKALNEETPLKLYFEPHLPDTSCTLTINW